MRCILITLLIMATCYSATASNSKYSMETQVQLKGGGQADSDSTPVLQQKVLENPVIKLTDREIQKDTLDLFITVHDAESRAALQRALELKKKYKINIHYYLSKKDQLISENINENYDAGKNLLATEETIRQICLREKYPDKYFNYLQIWLKSKQTGYWNRLLLAAKIDSQAVEKIIFSDELTGVLNKEVKLNQEFEIDYLPTFIWQNQLMIKGLANFNKLKDIRQGNI